MPKSIHESNAPISYTQGVRSPTTPSERGCRGHARWDRCWRGRLRQTRCWPGYRRKNRLTGGASRSKRAAGRDHLPWWRAILLQLLFALEVPGALSDSSTYKLTIWADRVHCAPIPVNRQSAHQLPNALGCDGKQSSDAPVATHLIHSRSPRIGTLPFPKLRCAKRQDHQKAGRDGNVSTRRREGNLQRVRTQQIHEGFAGTVRVHLFRVRTRYGAQDSTARAAGRHQLQRDLRLR